ncbi:hypothetical protein Q9L58_004955 [Maublancomyces gigas]|uniref:Biogenesis of lysosome-related organelles complex 1 subunit CNL1 n=1 Tax=Discina gigas TaxID=1032678 RepID=A0ABR3GJE0_9PEZI
MNPPPLTDPSLHLSHEDLSYIAAQQRRLRSAPPSSTTISSAGSAGGLSLDPGALQALSTHFDNLLASITQRVETLSVQTLRSTQASHRRASKVVDHATIEIETLRDILRQCDELQNEFLKIKRIGEIVKGFRIRVDSLEKRIGK